MKGLLNKLSNPNWVIRVLAFLLLLTFAISIRSLLLYALKGVIWAYLISYILAPIVLELEKREWPRTLAVLIIWITIALTIIVAIGLFIPIILEQVYLISQQWTSFSFSNQFSYQILEYIPERIQIFVSEHWQEWPEYLIKYIQNILKSDFFDELALYAVIPVLSFYMMLDREEWNSALLHVFPEKWRSEIASLGRKLNNIIGRWVRGQFLLSVIVFIATSIALYLVGAEYALLLGLINGIAHFIPYFGPVIGAVSGILIVFLKYQRLLIPTIIIYTIIQIGKSMFIMPIIISRQVYQKPAIILVALLIGGQIFGIKGLLLAVPALVLCDIIIEFFAGSRVRKAINDAE